MKTLDENVVIEAALRLIDKNGSTTTLEIKEDLRSQGYFATQNNVSALMFNAHASNGLAFTPSGNHRVYVREASNTSSQASNDDSMADALTYLKDHGLVSFPPRRKGDIEVSFPSFPGDKYIITKKGYAKLKKLDKKPLK